MISVDFETYSALPLGGANGVGVDNYAADPSARILCMAWTRDGDTDVALVTDMDEMRDLVVRWRTDGEELAAWNMNFERTMIERTLGVPLDPERLHDTMAHARMLGLPGALGNCALALGFPQGAQKDAAGKRLIRDLCVPQKTARGLEAPGPENVEGYAEKLRALHDYCRQDVRVEATLARLFGPMPPTEARVWRLDQAVNRRGVPVDLETARHLQAIRDAEWAELAERLDELTGVENAKNPGNFKAWLTARGYPVPNLRADTLARLASAIRADSALFPGWAADGAALEAMECYSDLHKVPAKKLEVFLRLASAPGTRVRDTHQYHAASTGRWSSHGPQLQNLPRPDRAIPDVDALGDELLGLDRRRLEARANVSPTVAVCSSLRGLVCASPGHRLIVADFSAIEARVTAWLAGEESLLATFRGDGRVYEAQAASMFRVPQETVTSHQRLLGKVAVLALGFAGGIGAFRSMGQVYGLPWIEDAEAKGYVDAYRAANPSIVEFWHDLERTALTCVAEDKRGLLAGDYTAGPEHCVPGPEGASLVGFDLVRRANLSVLRMRLPSGRRLHYWSPRIVEGKFGSSQLAYTGVDTKTRRWGPTSAWRGLLVENLVQAVARDLLASAMLRLDAAGYAIVAHVHDEVIIEAPDGEGSLDDVVAIMTEVPKWAPGLPVAAEGFEARRFRK